MMTIKYFMILIDPEDRKKPSLKIVKSRDTLISKKDNHVIFIIMEGMPFDKGS